MSLLLGIGDHRYRYRVIMWYWGLLSAVYSADNTDNYFIKTYSGNGVILATFLMLTMLTIPLYITRIVMESGKTVFVFDCMSVLMHLIKLQQILLFSHSTTITVQLDAVHMCICQ